MVVIASRLVVVAGLILGFAPTARAADGSISIRLADSSGNDEDPRAAYYVVDHVEPGSTLARRVVVGNTTGGNVDLDVYLGAASILDARFTFADEEVVSDLTRWSTVEAETVHVAAGATEDLEVLIEVPPDASPGERYGVIWAQLPEGPGREDVVNRVGVRVYLSVGPGDAPRRDLRIDDLTPRREDDRTAAVAVGVTNTGGRALDLAGSLQLTSAQRSLESALEGGRTLAPGATIALDARFTDHTADGPWDATVTVSGAGVTMAARARISFPGDAGETGASAAAEAIEQGASRTPILLVAAASLAIAVTIAARRRRESRS